MGKGELEEMRRALEDIAFLSRSETRATVLGAVADRGRELRALSDHLDVPRTTVSENLRHSRSEGG